MAVINKKAKNRVKWTPGRENLRFTLKSCEMAGLEQVISSYDIRTV